MLGGGGSEWGEGAFRVQLRAGETLGLTLCAGRHGTYVAIQNVEPAGACAAVRPGTIYSKRWEKKTGRRPQVDLDPDPYRSSFFSSGLSFIVSRDRRLAESGPRPRQFFS